MRYKVKDPTPLPGAGSCFSKAKASYLPVFTVSLTVVAGCETAYGFGTYWPVTALMYTCLVLVFAMSIQINGISNGPTFTVRDRSHCPAEVPASAGAILYIPELILLDQPQKSGNTLWELNRRK